MDFTYFNILKLEIIFMLLVALTYCEIYLLDFIFKKKEGDINE